jgi:hypothetical protein
LKLLRFQNRKNFLNDVHIFSGKLRDEKLTTDFYGKILKMYLRVKFFKIVILVDNVRIVVLVLIIVKL